MFEAWVIDGSFAFNNSSMTCRIVLQQKTGFCDTPEQNARIHPCLTSKVCTETIVDNLESGVPLFGNLFYRLFN